MPYREPTLTPPKGPPRHARAWAFTKRAARGAWRWTSWTARAIWYVVGVVVVWCFWPMLLVCVMLFGPKVTWSSVRDIWPDLD